MLRYFAVLVLLTACAHAHPSRWEDPSGKYTSCICEGKERNPTPSEAEDFRPGERIDTFCEGRVHDCREPIDDGCGAYHNRC